MKEIYTKIGLEKFLKLAFIIETLGDLFVVSLVYSQLKDLKTIINAVTSMLSAGGSITGELPVDVIQGQAYVIFQQVMLMLALFLAVHFILGLFLIRKKYFPFRYFRLYALIASPGFIIAGLTSLTSSPLWGLGFLIQGVLFTFTLIGFLKFSSNYAVPFKK